jgi:hypothetical protein
LNCRRHSAELQLLLSLAGTRFIDEGQFLTLQIKHIALALTVIYPMYLMLHATIAVNKAGARIKDECTNLLAASSSSECLDAMRFHVITHNKPCEILLLGYRVEPSDPVKLLATISVVQFLSVFGLSFIVGG